MDRRRALQLDQPALALLASGREQRPLRLFNADWSPKSAAPVIAQLNGLSENAGPSTFIPRALNVTTNDDGVNSMLIAKSNGSYVHLLWRSWPDGAVHPI